MDFMEHRPDPEQPGDASQSLSAEGLTVQTARHGGTAYSTVANSPESSAANVEQHNTLHSGERTASAAPNTGGLAVAFFLAREIAQVMLPALLLALVIHLFLAQATVVYGRSMEPNLFEAQRLIIDKISYRLHAPQRNDIVVLDLPSMDEMLVKRIVGLPGETVEVRDGMLYVNNALVDESFIDHSSHYDFPPITLGPLNYFVLGDNRGNSNDSRAFGPVQRDHIVGRVWLRYWPLHQFTLF